LFNLVGFSQCFCGKHLLSGGEYLIFTCTEPIAIIIKKKIPAIFMEEFRTYNASK